ncbi:unnamed protein product (macronuclear) [Paramecium tetraurelia]|uniref:Ion transport domain-containing protein n=1 Tax=Paramecium tetraurelia TaxID=5888 RepID=A0CBK6_PARTE|nr:uncharacterized protein GSPATT00036956001 [Paramecium tetraurelia]CAK68173.1 unnamed protein product [Paramecium tetraurelia]|eukprot:XP_001435570.1 hypothetical protein (macronuclear) [Paramecium tetraurelia strain d4-2]
MIEGNLGDLIWGSVELTLNVLLLDRLRLPQKMPASGVLKLSLIHEYNNYSDTKVRYVVASLLTPDIYKYFRNFQDPLQFIYGCFMFFDLFVILEVITNTETIQAATLLLRILRIINLIHQILKAAMTIKFKKTIKYIPPPVSKPCEVSPPQSLITTKANSNEDEYEQEVTKQPKKALNPCLYQFNIRTSKSSVITITTNEITQLDSILDDQLCFDKRTLLMIKLNLCLKAYHQNNIKKLPTSEILLQQIANYQAELMLIHS